jgi:hypothetical protein
VPGIIRHTRSARGPESRDIERAPDFAEPVRAWRVWYVLLQGRKLRLRSLFFDELARLDPLEAVTFQELGVCCFQQRPGNSAGPEVDVAPAVGADWVLDRHVGDLGSDHPL